MSSSNSSFLLTSAKRLAANTYHVPEQLVIKGIRLKSAIVNFHQKNVEGHVMFQSSKYANGTNPHTHEFPEELVIPDGTYTPAQYASTLQDILNRVSLEQLVPQSERQSGLTEEDLSDFPSQFTVKFNEATGKLEFEQHLKRGLDYNIFLSFNEEMSDFVGQPYGTHYEWQRHSEPAGPNDPSHALKTTVNKLQALPRYYRICSNQLARYGFAWDSARRSNIIGVVPIDYSKKWSTWETQDNHFHFLEHEQVKLESLMDITVHYEENHTPILDPEFVLVFQIQA